MGKITRLVVRKARTARQGEDEQWDRSEYELEAAIEDNEELEPAKAYMEGVIDGWFSKPAATPTKIPQLNPDESAKLPWRTYKTKSPCKPEEPGWIFSNTKGAEALAHLIEKQGNGVRVKIGRCTFEVRFSGAEKQFIGRSPIKE